jgi:MFS family permease
MPYNTGRGVWAELRKNLRWGAWGALGIVLFASIFSWWYGWNWYFFLMFLLAGPAIGLTMALWAFFAESEGEVSTAIFKALDFPNPKSLNLMSCSLCPGEGYADAYAIFRYRRVVSAADDRHGSPEPEPLPSKADALAQLIKDKNARR